MTLTGEDWDIVKNQIGYPYNLCKMIDVRNDTIYYRNGNDIFRMDLDGGNEEYVVQLNYEFSPHTTADFNNVVFFKDELYVVSQETLGTEVKVWRYDPTPGIVEDWEEVHSLTLDHYTMDVTLLANADTMLLILSSPFSSSWDEYPAFAHYTENGDSWYIVSMPYEPLVGKGTDHSLDDNIPITFEFVDSGTIGEWDLNIFYFDPPIIKHAYALPSGYLYGSSNQYLNVIYDVLSASGNWEADTKISPIWEDFESVSTNILFPFQSSNFSFFGIPCYSYNEFDSAYFHLIQSDGSVIEHSFVENSGAFSGILSLHWYKNYAYIMIVHSNASPSWTSHRILKAYFPIPPAAILQKDFGPEYMVGIG